MLLFGLAVRLRISSLVGSSAGFKGEKMNLDAVPLADNISVEA